MLSRLPNPKHLVFSNHLLMKRNVPQNIVQRLTQHVLQLLLSIIMPINKGRNRLTHRLWVQPRPSLDLLQSSSVPRTRKTQPTTQHSRSNPALAKPLVQMKRSVIQLHLLHQSIHHYIHQTRRQRNRPAFYGRKFNVKTSIQPTQNRYRLVHTTSSHARLQLPSNHSLQKTLTTPLHVRPPVPSVSVQRNQS